MKLRDELRQAIQEYADAVAADALAFEGHEEWQEEAEAVLATKARVVTLLAQVPAALEVIQAGVPPGRTVLRVSRPTPCD